MRLTSAEVVLAPLAGGLIGLVAFASSLGLEVLDPRNTEWLLHGDWRIHFLGWHMFRHGPWTWPIGATPLLASPVGSSVGLTDSIPLAAVLFKGLDPALPQVFQYFGLWLCSCFVLQGVFGAMLMRQATERVPLQILGAALLVLSPALVFRVAHPALTAHWLLLAALWLYFRKRGNAPPRLFLGWAVIAGIASGTHPYLLVMVLMLMGAAYARQVIVAPATTFRVACSLVAVVGLCSVILWQSGYFIVETTSDLQGTGFGFLSMNLLSPISPLSGSLFGAAPFRQASAGQYEGYAYLGAGMLLLSGVAVVRLAWTVPRVIKSALAWQHLPFVLACTILTILAVSPGVTLGERLLFTYPAEWWGPLTLFRSSGRMFWPVYYAIAFGTLGVIAKLGYRTAIVLLTIAVGLQAADLRGHYRATRDHRTLGFNNPLKSPFWAVAPPHYERLTLVPTSLCTPSIAFDDRAFILLAGRHGLAVNAGAAARHDLQRARQHCSELSQQLRSGHVAEDALYVLSSDAAALFKSAAGAALACTAVDRFTVCFSPRTRLAWQDAFDIGAGGGPSPP